MSDRDGIFNVLFLGMANTARSIMAEAILNREGRGNFRAYSAGIQAAAQIDPQAGDLLQKMHFDIAGAHPKDWNEFTGDDAPRFDFIFTVCDNATMLPKSIWPGEPLIAHFDIADPALAAGNEAQVRLAYADAFRMLWNRIMILVNLPVRSFDTLAMQKQLNAIGDANKPAEKPGVAA
jgi:arsenate reductase